VGSLPALAAAPASPARADLAAHNAALNRTHSMEGLRARGGAVVRRIEERRRALVASAVLARRPGTVVDVGCEDGWIAEAYAHGVGETVLVDLDPAMLARARERGLPRARTAVAEAGDLSPLGTLRADVVLLSAVLEHLDRPEEALAAAARVLRPGGAIVAYVPADRPILALKRVLRSTGLSAVVRGISLDPAPGHVRTFSRAGFAATLAAVGRVERIAFDPVTLGWLGVVRVDGPSGADRPI
jgi:SAM-dependent methyltransferase